MTAYGDDPKYHAMVSGRFVCTAPPEAPCRTSPTCECETWCGCDGSVEDAVDNHDKGEHCCMTATKPGQECWLVPWVEAVDLEDSYGDDAIAVVDWDAADNMSWPDGPVTCDWDDGVRWRYADA